MTKVYFSPTKSAGFLLEKVITENNIILEKEIPIKIHPGEPGNISYIKPEKYQSIIDYINRKGKEQACLFHPYYIETNTVTGQRTNATSHLRVAKEHGFTQIPFIIADGEIGNDQVIINGCKIARKLAEAKQIIVTAHFKGHVSAGFGAQIKQLGIGFASRAGKMHAHSKIAIPDTGKIIWANRLALFNNHAFRKNMTDYALAAVNGKKYIYITFATNIVENCDCDGSPMENVYEDLGILAGTDPVALDKAAFDLLAKREGKKPFDGDETFAYAEKIGLGKQEYELITV